jgi:hypothetical protein
VRLTRLLAAPLALTVTSLVGCASPPRPVDAELLRLTAVAEDGRPPIQAFAAPRIGRVALSPSGKYLAYEHHLDGATYLTTRALDGGERHVG